MDEPGVQQAMPPAGWFVDPSGTMRWWDGRLWTDHTAEPTPLGYSAGTHGTATPGHPSGVNMAAIAALCCGFIPGLGFIAIIPGVVALKQMKQTGQRGRIPAIIGITFGSLWLLDFILAGLHAAAQHS